jgi:DNA-binding NarL/FixJ family response regulator
MSAPASHYTTHTPLEVVAPLPPVRVLLADRESSVRTAVASLIEGIDGVRLVGQVATAEEIPAALRRTRADVLVVDDRLLTGERHPFAGAGPLPAAVRLIVLGMDVNPTFAARAKRLGAETWIAKELADEALPEALVP